MLAVYPTNHSNKTDIKKVIGHMNALDVIHEVAHDYPGGVEAISARMGKNPGTMRKKLLPNEDSHDLTVKELLRIVDYCNTDRIAKAFADQRGLMCIKKPEYENLSDQAILDLFLLLQIQQGEWAKEISTAMQNGEIDWDELQAIRKEYAEFITAAAEIMNRLECFMALSEERKAKRSK